MLLMPKGSKVVFVANLHNTVYRVHVTHLTHVERVERSLNSFNCYLCYSTKGSKHMFVLHKLILNIQGSIFMSKQGQKVLESS